MRTGEALPVADGDDDRTRLLETLDAPGIVSLHDSSLAISPDGERAILTEATIQVSNRLDELHAVRRSVDRWILIAVFATAVLAFLLVSWLSSRVAPARSSWEVGSSGLSREDDVRLNVPKLMPPAALRSPMFSSGMEMTFLGRANARNNSSSVRIRFPLPCL